MRAPTIRLAALLAVLGALASAATVAANGRAGELDRSFGGDGRVLTPLNEPSIPLFAALARQPNGRILALGAAQQNNVLLVGYRSDGALDRSFGTEGRVVVQDRYAIDLVLEPDGAIAVLAERRLLRFLPDGTADASFGAEGGEAHIPIATASLARQPDGRLVVAGAVFRAIGGSRGERDSAAVGVARYHADGSLDESFGGDGRVITSLGPDVGIAEKVLVQPDGKIVVLASYESPRRDSSVLLRYLPDGSLDPSFGSRGRARLAGYGEPGSESLVRQPDGRLIVALGYNSFPTVVVARFRRDGSADRSFGRRGIVVKNFRESQPGLGGPTSLALGRDGRIYLGGLDAHEISDRPGNFVIARFTRTGSLDGSWGRGGLLSTRFDRRPRAFAQLRGLLLQPDGRLVAGGLSNASSFALARYRTR